MYRSLWRSAGRLFRVARRFRWWSPGRKRLFLRAVMTTAAIRSCLWLVPARHLLRFVSMRVARHRPSERHRHSVWQIVREVETASRGIPEASCLTQALTAQLLLARFGYPSDLRIGVGRGDDGQFTAHAWVEISGYPVIGGSGLHRYARMPDLDPILIERATSGRP